MFQKWKSVLLAGLSVILLIGCAADYWWATETSATNIIPIDTGLLDKGVVVTYKENKMYRKYGYATSSVSEDTNFKHIIKDLQKGSAKAFANYGIPTEYVNYNQIHTITDKPILIVESISVSYSSQTGETHNLNFSLLHKNRVIWKGSNKNFPLSIMGISPMFKMLRIRCVEWTKLQLITVPLKVQTAKS